MIIIVIWVIIFSIIFFGFIFTNNASALASVVNPVKITFQPIFIILTLFFLIETVIPYYILANSALKSTNPDIKLKGKFLIVGFILYPLGTLFDLLSGDIILIVIIARIIAIMSAIMFYLGFVLPESIKKIFLKKN